MINMIEGDGGGGTWEGRGGEGKAMGREERDQTSYLIHSDLLISVFEQVLVTLAPWLSVTGGLCSCCWHMILHVSQDK